jgi:hypothetical protein
MERLEIVLKSFCDFSYKNGKTIARLIPSTDPDNAIYGEAETEQAALIIIADKIKNNKELIEDIYSFYNSLINATEE